MSLTPPQARDALLESVPVITTELAREARNAALECEAQRKADPETYFKCPRCKAHHSIHANFDNLCDGCCRTILEHFPEHESVPLIKASLEKWRTK